MGASRASSFLPRLLLLPIPNISAWSHPSSATLRHSASLSSSVSSATVRCCCLPPPPPRSLALAGTDTLTQTIALLGSFPAPDAATARNAAVVRIERAALPLDDAASILGSGIADTRLIESNDIVRMSICSSDTPSLSLQYTWLHGWLSPSTTRSDVKINIICPATEVHIRKVLCLSFAAVCCNAPACSRASPLH